MTALSKKKIRSQIPLSELNADVNKRIKLCVDIFYANEIEFLHTKSKDLNYISIQRFKLHLCTEIGQKKE